MHFINLVFANAACSLGVCVCGLLQWTRCDFDWLSTKLHYQIYKNDKSILIIGQVIPLIGYCIFTVQILSSWYLMYKNLFIFEVIEPSIHEEVLNIWFVSSRGFKMRAFRWQKANIDCGKSYIIQAVALFMVLNCANLACPCHSCCHKYFTHPWIVERYATPRKSSPKPSTRIHTTVFFISSLILADPGAASSWVPRCSSALLFHICKGGQIPLWF